MNPEAMSTTEVRLTLAMLRFVQRVDLSDEQIFWWIWPEGRRVDEADFIDMLAAMPKPQLVSAHMEPGDVTVLPLASVAGSGHGRMERCWRSQQQGLRASLAQLVPGGETVPVLLELHDRELVVSSDELAMWAQDYVMLSGSWMVVGSKGDTRAPLRMLLRRPDGSWSPGYASRLGPLPDEDPDEGAPLVEYLDLGGQSGILAYQIGRHFVRVQFRDGGVYRYTCDSTGQHHVEMMKQLALAGQGLNSYINEHVRKNFASRER